MLKKTADAIHAFAHWIQTADMADSVWDIANQAEWKDSDELQNALTNVANGLSFSDEELSRIQALCAEQMDNYNLYDRSVLRLIDSKIQKLRES